MRTLPVIVAAIALAVAAASTAVAQSEKPGVVVADVSVLTATVEAIDLATRTVTLEGPEGNSVTVKVDPGVRNLDQVQPGDKVTVEHYESVALFVRAGGEPPSAMEAAAVEVAPRGQKPAGFVVETTEITATVEAIDHQARTVTLKGPEGNMRTIKVDPSVKRFGQVKKGDEVVLRVTDALAISISKQ
jgi:DNA-binding beta-propeller fold protein YncE